MYEMKKEYYTGIEQIDKEHERLFEIANELYQLSKEEFIADKYDNIRSLLDELREYTKYHFRHEEEYMQSIGYKQMFMQKVQHDAFINQLDDWDLEDLEENQEETIDAILKHVTDWLIEHILEEDKKIGQS